MHNTNEGWTTAAGWTFQTCWASDDGSIIRIWSAVQGGRRLHGTLTVWNRKVTELGVVTVYNFEAQSPLQSKTMLAGIKLDLYLDPPPHYHHHHHHQHSRRPPPHLHQRIIAIVLLPS